MKSQTELTINELIENYNTFHTGDDVDLSPIILSFLAVHNDYVVDDRGICIEFAGFLTGYIQGLHQAHLEEDSYGFTIGLLAQVTDHIETLVYLRY